MAASTSGTRKHTVSMQHFNILRSKGVYLEAVLSGARSPSEETPQTNRTQIDY